MSLLCNCRCVLFILIFVVVFLCENYIYNKPILGVENSDNWEWFVQLLFADFPGISVVLADKATGLQQVWWGMGEVQFRRCVHHMYGNMKNVVKGASGTIIENLIYALAKAPSQSLYTHRLMELRFRTFFVFLCSAFN